MARTGRPRKPPDQEVQGHRSAAERAERAERRLTVLHADPPADFVVPEPPLTVKDERLCDRALLLWDRFWLSPVAQALDGVQGVDRYVVEEWIRAVDELELLQRVIEGSRLVQGSQGQPVNNPLTSQRDEARRVVWRCQEKLGLTPQDRARLGLTIGEGKMTAARLNQMLREDEL